MNIDEARALMNEWTGSEALRVHMESVAACMSAYADRLAPDQKSPSFRSAKSTARSASSRSALA